MSREVRAIFRNGEVTPLEPLDLPENASLRIVIDESEVQQEQSVNGDADDPLARIHHIAENIGPADLATNLDHYLYGLPKVE